MSKTNINPYPELLPEEIIRRAGLLSSANLCDGMKGLHIPMDGCMDARIHPLVPDMKFVGTAMTVETRDGDNLPIHLALYTSNPGYVMVIDGADCEDYPYFGDLMMSTAKAEGFLAMVVNGFVRDYDGAVALGLPVFAKGLMPRGPRKSDPGTINGTIICGRVTVHPGDLVLGDYDGIAVVPREQIEQVLAKAEEKVDYEKKRRAAIQDYAEALREGKELPNLMPKWVKEMLE